MSLPPLKIFSCIDTATLKQNRVCAEVSEVLQPTPLVCWAALLVTSTVV